MVPLCVQTAVMLLLRAGSAAGGDSVRLRAHPARGTLVRYEMYDGETTLEHLVQGPATIGGLTYLTMAIVDEHADTIGMRITVDSNFEVIDQERRVAPGASLIGHVVTSDDRREHIQVDSIVARHFFGFFPLPNEPKMPGAVWSREVDYLEPQGNGDQGRMHGTVKMKLRQVLVTEAESSAVLELSLTAQGGPFPSGQGSIRRTVTLRGTETLSLTRGVTTDLTLEGTATDDIIALGLRLPQRWHVRLTRRLLTAQ